MFGRKKKSLISDVYPETKLNLMEINGLLEISEKIKNHEKRLKSLEEKIAINEPEDNHKIRSDYISTISGFETQEDFDRLVGIISRIKERDDSFTFVSNEEKLEISLHCKSKDEAMKKSMWLISKTGIEGLKFNVKQ